MPPSGDTLVIYHKTVGDREFLTTRTYSARTGRATTVRTIAGRRVTKANFQRELCAAESQTEEAPK